MFNKLNIALGTGLIALVLVISVLVGGNHQSVSAPHAGAAPVSGANTNYDNLALGVNNATTTGTLTLNGRSEVVSSAVCADATNTIFAIANPFGATSTVSNPVVYGQNGTSTIDIIVGTTTVAGAAAAPTALMAQMTPTTSALMVIRGIATSTQFYATNNSILDNRESFSVAPVASTTLIVGPNDILIGVATGTAFVGDSVWSASTTLGITNPVNTFSCSYKIPWRN